MIKCILFDRDGTLGELSDNRYPQTFSPNGNIKAVFAQLKSMGFLVGILTNQSSIARGTAVGYDFAAEFLSYGADIWEICPHDTDDNCDCRKPKSGLLLRVCERLKISPTECLVVGDRLSDVQCAKNVGAKAVLVLTGRGTTEKKSCLLEYPELPILTCFDKILSYIAA